MIRLKQHISVLMKNLHFVMNAR